MGSRTLVDLRGPYPSSHCGDFGVMSTFNAAARNSAKSEEAKTRVAKRRIFGRLDRTSQYPIEVVRTAIQCEYSIFNDYGFGRTGCRSDRTSFDHSDDNARRLACSRCPQLPRLGVDPAGRLTGSRKAA